MNASGQWYDGRESVRTSQTSYMGNKEHMNAGSAIGEALQSGYRASRMVGTAHRRASDENSQAVVNELERARASLDEALFCLEEVGGVEGSVRDSLSQCRDFEAKYRKALEMEELGCLAAGTLRSGLGDVTDAVDCLSSLVDGYRSFHKEE